GSKDKTVEIIRHYQKKYGGIKFMVEKGGIAHGRNTGIEVARHDIIATTDAGCVPHQDWLERITAPFKHANVGLVAGFYDMPVKTPMQKAVSVFLGIPAERYDPATFLPSTRSMAFKKHLWERVGGFNERLDKAGEDTQFFYNIVKTGTKIIRVGEARVDWKEFENISFKEAMRKFFNYAKGDAKSKIWWHPTKKLMSHNIKVVFIFIRYLFGLFLLFQSIMNPPLFRLLEILVVLYIFWPIWKWRDVIYDLRTKLWLPVIQISSDFAVMSGFLYGLL
ncbi:MAG: glycosyltransferase, partial [bacterium]